MISTAAATAVLGLFPNQEITPTSIFHHIRDATTIGIDISKDSLDVHRLPSCESQRFTNDKPGHEALLGWIGPLGAARIVYEPTGAYHQKLEHALARAGLPLVKVNPHRARSFAQATGLLAKTDRIDAFMLARMGMALDLEPHAAPDETLSALRELHATRRALVKDRTATGNRAKQATHILIKRQLATRMKQIDSQLAAVDKAIETAIRSDKKTARHFDILLGIPGIAKITAFAIMIEMPELGDMTGAQAASLAGLASRDRQSGKWTGRAHIRGGRAGIRHALYMPTLVAVRYNPDLKRHYSRLIEAGKPAKIATVAAMRKLLTIANALIRDDRIWNENHA